MSDYSVNKIEQALRIIKQNRYRYAGLSKMRFLVERITRIIELSSAK
jgi:hypothetical protein